MNEKDQRILLKLKTSLIEGDSISINDTGFERWDSRTLGLIDGILGKGLNNAHSPQYWNFKHAKDVETKIGVVESLILQIEIDGKVLKYIQRLNIHKKTENSKSKKKNSKEQDLLGTVNKWFRNNKFFVGILFIFGLVIGISKFTDAISKIEDFACKKGFINCKSENPSTNNANKEETSSMVHDTIGNYNISGIKIVDQVDRKIYRAEMIRFQGTNTNVFRMARPLNGYLWDLRKDKESRKEFQITQGNGEKGRCEMIIWNDSNESGIKIQARCDQIREINLSGVIVGAGYVHCNLVGPIYKNVTFEKKIDRISGFLTRYNDVSISLPKNLKSFVFTLNTFDGKKIMTSDNYTDDIVDVKLIGNNLTIRAIK